MCKVLPPIVWRCQPSRHFVEKDQSLSVASPPDTTPMGILYALCTTRVDPSSAVTTFLPWIIGMNANSDATTIASLSPPVILFWLRSTRSTHLWWNIPIEYVIQIDWCESARVFQTTSWLVTATFQTWSEWICAADKQGQSYQGRKMVLMWAHCLHIYITQWMHVIAFVYLLRRKLWWLVPALGLKKGVWTCRHLVSRLSSNKQDVSGVC